MSSKPKALLKHSKAKHKKEQSFDNADDYQAAGVDFEDAAGKWRAGDAVKSMRFFNRALEVYEQGLQRFPQSFDLAYNKARVQLEVATHPILVKLLQQPTLVALQAALESHRYALSLNQDNADTLFNTSQVLTTIAEEFSKDDTLNDAEAIQYLKEALQLQDRCLSLQELKYEESTEQQRDDREAASSSLGTDEDNDDGGAPIGSSKEHEEQWFSIVEPVTQDTLIDTALAQLGTLTTLCGVLSSSPDAAPQSTLAWIEEYSSRILATKLPSLLKNQDLRLSEIALVKGNFASALLEAGFRAGKIDAATYKRERDGAFAAPELELEKSVEALISNARSLMIFNIALAETRFENIPDAAVTRWSALSAAITNLFTASKLEGISTDDLAKCHLLRGDCSMLQQQMGTSLVRYQNAISNASQLLRNAEVFYRNASKLSPDADEKATASFRSAMALYLQKGEKSSLVSASQGRNQAWVMEQLEDMVLEGLLPFGFQIS